MTQKTVRLLLLNAFGNNLGDQAILIGFLHSFLPAAARRDIEINIHQEFVYTFRFDEHNIDEINDAYDLIVLGGGGIIFHRPPDKSPSGWGMNISLELLERLRVPFVIYAAGYNYFPFSSYRFPDITRTHLQRAAAKSILFSAREHQSIKRLVQEMGIETPISFVPDPAIHVNAKPPVVPELDTRKTRIGLCLRLDNVAKRFPPPSAETFKAFLAELIGALKILASKHNCQIVHTPHLYLKEDKFVARILKETLPEGTLINLPDALPSLYTQTPSAAKPEILAGIYAQLDAVLGKRLHSNILPFSVGTPVVAISSTQSNRWILEEIGCPEYHIDILDFDNQIRCANILDKLLSALADKERLQTLYRTKKAEFVTAADDAHNRIFDAL